MFVVAAAAAVAAAAVYMILNPNRSDINVILCIRYHIQSIH